MGIFEIFIKPVFWIVMGGLYSLFFYSATLWAKDLRLKMNWWKWILAIFWFLFLSLSIAGGFTLIGENEIKPGLYFLFFFLIINIIAGILIWRIIGYRKEPKEKTDENR